MTIHLPVTPVGAQIFRDVPAWVAALPIHRGISFCEAVARAARGEAVVVGPGSIDTCRWAPAGLGLAAPESNFEGDITPSLPLGTAAIVLAPVDRFPPEGTPDVVIVKAPAETIVALAGLVGWDEAAWEHVEPERIAKSALRRLREGGDTWRTRVLKPVNRGFAALEKVPGWKSATVLAFKSRKVSAAFEALISRTLASMSVCRNSLVIPYSTGRFNASFFCSGGITWGDNYPFHLTSGWPWEQWRRVRGELSW